MSDRNFTKTNKEEKKKAVEEARKKMPKKRQIVVSSLHTSRVEVTESHVLMSELIAFDAYLKNIMFSIEDLSPREVTATITVKNESSQNAYSYQIGRGITAIKEAIKLNAGCIVSVNIDHSEEFRVQNLHFTATALK